MREFFGRGVPDLFTGRVENAGFIGIGPVNSEFTKVYPEGGRGRGAGLADFHGLGRDAAVFREGFGEPSQDAE